MLDWCLGSIGEHASCVRSIDAQSVSIPNAYCPFYWIVVFISFLYNILYIFEKHTGIINPAYTPANNITISKPLMVILFKGILHYKVMIWNLTSSHQTSNCTEASRDSPRLSYPACQEYRFPLSKTSRGRRHFQEPIRWWRYARLWIASSMTW